MGGIWECSLRHGSDVFSNRRLDDLNKKTVFRIAAVSVGVFALGFGRERRQATQHCMVRN